MNRAHATERAAHAPQGETLSQGKKFTEEGLLFHASAYHRSVHTRSRRQAMHVLALRDLLLQRIEELRILLQRLAGLLTPLSKPFPSRAEPRSTLCNDPSAASPSR